jgi:hypothetical protein
MVRLKSKGVNGLHLHPVKGTSHPRLSITRPASAIVGRIYSQTHALEMDNGVALRIAADCFKTTLEASAVALLSQPWCWCFVSARLQLPSGFSGSCGVDLTLAKTSLVGPIATFSLIFAYPTSLRSAFPALHSYILGQSRPSPRCLCHTRLACHQIRVFDNVFHS